MVKEFHQIIRDPSSILLAIVFPLLLLFIYGYGISLDMNNLRVGVLQQDLTSDAQSFTLSLKNSRFFSITQSEDEKELTYQLMTGKLRGIVTIPFYFSEYKNRPDRKGPIYVVSDGSEPNTASFVQNYVQAAWVNWLTQQAISNAEPVGLGPIATQPRFWFNEELSSRNFLIPGTIALIITLIGTLLTALVIAREWERGTMEALMATPITMGEIIAAKLICYFVMGMISMTVCTLISYFYYDVPLRGSFLALAMVSSTYLLASLATGLLISSVSRNQFVASQLSLVSAYLPAFMLSGFLFEITSMPKAIQWFTYILPARYMVPCLQTIFLAGNIWSLLLLNSALMLLLAAALFVLISFKIVKRLD